MIVKNVKYTDYLGNERTKECRFNLNKAELVELQFGNKTGLDKAIQAMIDSNDTPQIMKLFKEIVLKSYGVISDDGDMFIKSEELSNNFTQTAAYSELMMELLSDENQMSAFINGLMPRDLVAQIEKENNIVEMKKDE